MDENKNKELKKNYINEIISRLDLLKNVKELHFTHEFFPQMDNQEINSHRPALCDNHCLMYKLYTNDNQTWLEDEDKTSRYEFLIEFTKDAPWAEIYYGCKCLTIKESENHNVKTDKYREEWVMLRPIILETLKNELNFDATLCLRENTTNNSNNTFWPFWIRANFKEDIVNIPVKALKIIKNVYQSYLTEGIDSTRKDYLGKKLYKVKEAIIKSSDFPDLDIENVRDELNKNFTKFLALLENLKILKQDEVYWKINERMNAECHRYIVLYIYYLHAKYRLNADEKKFKELWESDTKKYGYPDIPWKAFCTILRNHDGEELKNNLKTAIAANKHFDDKTNQRYEDLRDKAGIVNFKSRQ